MFLIPANDVDIWHQKVIKISSSKLIFYVKNHSNHDDFFINTVPSYNYRYQKKSHKVDFRAKMNQAPNVRGEMPQP